MATRADSVALNLSPKYKVGNDGVNLKLLKASVIKTAVNIRIQIGHLKDEREIIYYI